MDARHVVELVCDFSSLVEVCLCVTQTRSRSCASRLGVGSCRPSLTDSANRLVPVDGRSVAEFGLLAHLHDVEIAIGVEVDGHEGSVFKGKDKQR